MFIICFFVYFYVMIDFFLYVDDCAAVQFYFINMVPVEYIC